MKKLSMILGIVGSLLLLFTFLLPIWSINLQAPQYPDGITMYIWINQITGETESTLQNINILNHYVGMKFITPESIPELTIFPYIIVFMTVLGLVFAFLNKSKYYLIWVIMWVLLGTAGMYDFYLWEYDYGHNLNPQAPIKIPGQSYQPPLFGSEMLLNFKATSLPHTGSLFLGLGILFNLVAALILFKFNKKSKILNNSAIASLFIFCSLMFSSCSPQPEEIEFGKDECVYCKMTIVDQKFGAELVSSKGKVFKFDAIECMLDYIYDSEEVTKDYAFYLVNRFNQPKVLNDATNSFFLISPKIQSPMGGNLSAYATSDEAKTALADDPGDLYNWQELNEFFKTRYDKFKRSH